MKASCAVNLHNAVTVSQDRLGARVGHLSSIRMNEICAALHFSLGCDQGDS
jgi:mRNA-degrading endonuclease toxin of MazEF toxin-antitoxin module